MIPATDIARALLIGTIQVAVWTWSQVATWEAEAWRVTWATAPWWFKGLMVAYKIAPWLLFARWILRKFGIVRGPVR